MIYIITGHSKQGGSTEAFINLTNEFNKRGIDCIMCGPHDYHLNKCRSKNLKDLKMNEIKPIDCIISHYTQIKGNRPNVRTIILSCHEQHDFPLNTVNLTPFDKIHFVSQHQKEWHNISYIKNFIVGNIYDPVFYDKKYCKGKKPNIIGIVGSIYPQKRTHEAIQWALADIKSGKSKCKKINIYGNIPNQDYFDSKVKPLIDDNLVHYIGFVPKELIYPTISDLYICSESECLSSTIGESKLCNVKIHIPKDRNYKNAKYWFDKDEIINIWIKELGL